MVYQRPEVSKIQDIVSETRMYLENFIQELIIEFIFRNGNESRHQISNFIVNNEIEIRKRNTKPADVTLYISEETEDQVIRSFLLRLK